MHYLLHSYHLLLCPFLIDEKFTLGASTDKSKHRSISNVQHLKYSCSNIVAKLSWIQRPLLNAVSPRINYTALKTSWSHCGAGDYTAKCRQGAALRNCACLTQFCKTTPFRELLMSFQATFVFRWCFSYPIAAERYFFGPMIRRTTLLSQSM